MEVTWLGDVLADLEPAVTVTVDVSTPDESGAQQRETRWRDLRRELESDGATEADLAAVDEVLAAPTEAGGAQVRFVAVRAEQVLLNELMFESARDGVGSASLSRIVDVVPLLRHQARHAPVVVVRADREGADIEVVTAAGGPALDGTSSDGSTEHIRKVQVGGWRHSHYQRVSENVWRGNAENAAVEAGRLLERNAATLVLVSGDVRARQLLVDALPDRVPVVQVEGDTRADGASTVAVDLTVARSLDERAAREEDEAVRRWRAVHDDEDTRDRTTDDLPGTVRALQQGGIDELLLVPSVLRTRHLQGGPAGTDVALPGAPVFWDGEVHPVPADLALIRAAALTGATVQLVELESGALTDGVAARLRWSTGEESDPTKEA
jgi:hypothetical protein